MTWPEPRHPRTTPRRVAHGGGLREDRPRARRHLRFLRSDRYRPRGRPPRGGPRGPAPGEARPRRARRARVGPGGRAGRRGHFRRRRCGGGARRCADRRPAVERGPQAADPRQPQRAHRGARGRGRRAPRPDLPVGVGGGLLRQHRRPRHRRERPVGHRVPRRGVPRQGGRHPQGRRRGRARGQPAHRAGAGPGGRAARHPPAAVQVLPRRPNRLGHPVHAVDLPRRRGRRHPARAGKRRRLRPGQPDRADPGHQRRVHEGARRGRAPAHVAARARVRDQDRAGCDGRGAAAVRPARRARPAGEVRLPVPPPHPRRRALGGGRRMTAPATDHDVVIVGAGLAGLRAAGVLARRGLDVRVLDAADRPGGRVATDVVDGFRLDRGFQVLNTVYPALRAAVDLGELHLNTFVPGAAIRAGDGELHTFGNPLRRRTLAWPTAADRLFSPLAKARLVAWTAQVLATPPQRTALRIDRSAARDFAAAHLDGPLVEQFLRPFLSGVLGERELVTSAAYVRLVWRCFALGSIAVPADGMGALPALLAEGLPEKALSTGRRVTRVGPGQVEVDGETLRARAGVVATDPRTAGELVPGLDAPQLRTLTTYHHAAPTPPADAGLLHLDGTGGPLANTVVMPASAAPAGRVLVLSSVVDPAIPEAEIRRELGRVYGTSTEGWELLRVDEVRDALPAFPAGRPLRSPVELGEGLFVAGDHRDTPAQQGALVSGRRAAEAVLAHLGA